ncbi:MAG: aminopeptidase P family protein [Robiginitomaculum sp.]|nr:aminopeptidase P family protein [Robiginitomaculum sp.]
MNISTRDFIGAGGLAAAGLALNACGAPQKTNELSAVQVKTQMSSLITMTKKAPKITKADYVARIEKAQNLMQQFGIGALILESGASLQYFTGISWWRSERLTAAVLPVVGKIGVVTPQFEEPSIRESMMVGNDVRVWNEHESPFKRVVGILKDRGVLSGKIAIEDSVRYFAVKGIQNAGRSYELVSGGPIVWGCRMYKSPKEIELMQLANNVTIAAYRFTYPKIEIGMTPRDISSLMSKATEALGANNEFSLVLLNEASAYPHGSKISQTVKDGGVVLMDCGASVNGYQSDISRTIVIGEPSKRQSEIWNLVRDGQALAFETAKLGTATGKVDDAVRKLYESKGFGPGYKLPGLSHRTGHGIGLEGHEQVNFVHGETTRLAPGMCLSNEPGLYIMGEFGVRFEDCLYMTETGSKYFTAPPVSLSNPIG